MAVYCNPTANSQNDGRMGITVKYLARDVEDNLPKTSDLLELPVDVHLLLLCDADNDAIDWTS